MSSPCTTLVEGAEVADFPIFCFFCLIFVLSFHQCFAQIWEGSCCSMTPDSRVPDDGIEQVE